MPSPFPGMDPYLESPEFWAELHQCLMAEIAATIAIPLHPMHQVVIQERTYFDSNDDVSVGVSDATLFSRSSQSSAEEIPSYSSPEPVSNSVTHREPIKVAVPVPTEIQETYVEIIDTSTREIITLLEVLSPGNKRVGEGRRLYEFQRQQVLTSSIHLIEIDLLRAGKPMPVLGHGQAGDYRILVSRSDRRPESDLYVFNLQEPIPSFPLPLMADAIEPRVELQSIFNRAYDQLGCSSKISYTQPLTALLNDQTAWVDRLLQAKGFRGSSGC